MSNPIIESILASLALDPAMAAIQRVQTQHRLNLANFWDIKPGDRILEVGCGQGDTTAVLAYLVGQEGLVYGVDIAPPDYGGPITVGEAAQMLKSSPLGQQISMNFEFDILSPDVNFPDQHFDVVVLSHSTWYLKDADELTAILARLRKWGKRLCLAEWDSRITSVEQFPHFLAASIQAQYEVYKQGSLSNIRTLFTAADFREQVGQAGWRILKETAIISAGLQDAQWEVGFTLKELNNELDRMANLPDKLKALLQSQAKLLREISQDRASLQALPTFTLVAE